VVIAVRLTMHGTREALIGRLPMTGEEVSFILDELEDFQVLG